MTRRAATVLVSLILSWPVLFCASYAQQLVVIRGGTLIDGNGGPPLRNATVLIERDRIKEIRTAPLDPVPANATVIEAAGKFLIPGLHDSHVHYKDWMPPLYINHGVTTMHDIGNNPTEWILAQREMFQKEKIVGPRLYAALLNLWGKRQESDLSNLPNMVIFDTAQDARKWAQKAVDLKADYIKVHEGFTGEMLLAVSQVAKANGLAVVGHVAPNLDAFQAAEMGQNHFEHSTGVGRAIAKDPAENEKLEKELNQALRGRARDTYEPLVVDFYSVDPAKEDKLIPVLIQKNIYLEADWVTPSRNITPRKKDWAFQDMLLLMGPEMGFVPKDARYRWLNYTAWESFPEDLKAKLTRGLENWKNFIVKFSAAGGKLVVGTAAPNPIPGISVHRDMQLMVDAGMPPMKALQAATKNIAEMTRKTADLGTLEAGKYADLLILDGNPLEDISNTQKIAQVMKGGKIIDRRYSSDFRNPLPTTEVTDDVSHNSPTPTITEIEPPVALEGDPEKVIQIKGRRFMLGSTAYLNRVSVKTVFKSPGILEVTVPKELLLQTGTFPVQVVNPEPLPPLENAGVSNKLMFLVKFR